MNKIPYISIVSPVYKAEKILPNLVNEIIGSVKTLTDDYEIILVEDCSPDNSWEIIETIAHENQKVKGFKLSKNFGQHYAITCGLDHALGEWIIVMDCDLQDRPDEIPNLFNHAINNNKDIVLASRVNRNDTFYKRLSSIVFYKFLTYLTGMKYDDSLSNFGIYSRNVINTINSMREPMRAFPPMVQWVGFNKDVISVKHSNRFEGKSSYNFKKLLELALDISLAYSVKPLKLTVKLGFFISSLSMIYALYTIFEYYNGYIKVSGFTTLAVSIWFLSGIIIFILGIIGLYIGKIFDGIKNRPLYIIGKKV